MNEHRDFERIAGLAGILTTLFMIGNIVTLLASVGKDTNALFDGAEMLSLGAPAAAMFHASMVFDLLAYLSLAPVVVCCWSWLKPGREGLVSLYAFCGVAYSLLGSIGAVVIDAVFPQLMTSFASTPAAQRELLQVIALVLYRAVEHGIWNPLEVLMVSIWFLGIGLLLRRIKPGLGILAIVIGALGLLDPLGWMIGSDTVLSIGGFSNILVPVWTAWFGIALLRNPLSLGIEKGSVHAR
jgi:hypothetical protein